MCLLLKRFRSLLTYHGEVADLPIEAVLHRPMVFSDEEEGEDDELRHDLLARLFNLRQLTLGYKMAYTLLVLPSTPTSYSKSYLKLVH